jgi:hypothetical protein
LDPSALLTPSVHYYSTNAEERRATLPGNVTFVYWQEDDAWLGYLQDFPDDWTQGESVEDLQEHLADIDADLTAGHIPNVRKGGELPLPRDAGSGYAALKARDACSFATAASMTSIRIRTRVYRNPFRDIVRFKNPWRRAFCACFARRVIRTNQSRHPVRRDGWFQLRRVRPQTINHRLSARFGRNFQLSPFGV